MMEDKNIVLILKSLQRKDASVSSILGRAPHAALYTIGADGSWVCGMPM